MSQITMTTEMTLNDCVELGYDKSDICDEVTWAALVEWFGLRRVQPNFDRFFTRALKKHYPHYMELIRIEPSVAKYDWFVENYKEQQTLLTGNNTKNIVDTRAENKSGINGGTITVTGHDGNTRAIDTEDANTGSSSDTHNGSNSSSSADVNRSTSAMRNAPMSASITGTRNASAGSFSKSMAWNDITNPTQTDDNLSDNAHNESGIDSSSDTHSNIDTTSHTGSIVDTGSMSRQTTNALTHSETNSVTDESTISGNNATETRTILKGRDKGIAELLMQAKEAILETESLDWLVGKLEPCFMQTF